MKKYFLIPTFLLCSCLLYSSAQGQSYSIFAGYSDYDSAIMGGAGFDIFENYYGDRYNAFTTIELGMNEDEHIIGKLGVYVYLYYNETLNNTYSFSIGGAFGWANRTNSLEESNMQILYEGGANLQLGWILIGYGYGWDDFYQSEYNYIRAGIKFDV